MSKQVIKGWWLPAQSREPIFRGGDQVLAALRTTLRTAMTISGDLTAARLSQPHPHLQLWHPPVIATTAVRPPRMNVYKPAVEERAETLYITPHPFQA